VGAICVDGRAENLENVCDLWEHPSFVRKPSVRIDDQILKCVAFLGLRTGTEGDPNADWRATAFIIDILSHDKKITHVYLVTAKHNVDAIAGREFLIGMNLTERRGLAYINGPANQKWWLHPDTPDEVDIAVLPFQRYPDIDMASVPLECFLSEPDIPALGIGPGDEVFAVGLFTKMTGKRRLVSIVRTGNIAMMPDEKIPGIKINQKWTTGEVEAYLIEARSIGGMSGSPVFVRQTVHHKTVDGKTGETLNVLHGLGSQHLLGLVNGHWEIRASERNKARISAYPRGAYDDQVNLGIAVVVPCKKIAEVLNHPELIAMRLENERKFGDTGSTEHAQ
jgi:hypothetical protein